MVRGIACLMVGSVITAASAGAQVSRRGGQEVEPGYWVGLSIGYQDGITTTDNRTDATWAFSYAAQLRATLEKVLQPGVSIGVAAGFSTPSLTYTGGQFDVACPGICQGHADITQYLAFLHGTLGGVRGIGFHWIYQIEAGATQFSNFRDQVTNTQIVSNSGSYDFTFGVGGGAGYDLSPTMNLYAIPAWDIILHPQSTAVTAQNAPQMTSFRVGIRVGF